MKTYLCKVCGHIEFNEIPAKCPVCGATSASFQDAPDIIKRPGAAVLGEPEKKHIPAITIVKKCGLIPQGCVDLHAKIGEIEHPMQADHYITTIEFYLNKKFISRVDLTTEALHPAAALHLKVSSGTITVVEHCSIHGYWMAETTL